MTLKEGHRYTDFYFGISTWVRVGYIAHHICEIQHDTISHMPRRSESPYQLLFDLRFKPEESAFTYPVKSGIFSDFAHHEGDAGRFVRSVQERFTVRAPADVARFVQEQIYTPWEDFTQEELYTLMLDNKNKLTHAALVYRGTIDSVHIRVAEVFRPAILVNARAIVITHNHPSSDPEPSPQDANFTQMCVEAGRLLDVECVDHLVVGKEAFVSMRDRGLTFD